MEEALLSDLETASREPWRGGTSWLRVGYLRRRYDLSAAQVAARREEPAEKASWLLGEEIPHGWRRVRPDQTSQLWWHYAPSSVKPIRKKIGWLMQFAIDNLAEYVERRRRKLFYSFSAGYYFSVFQETDQDVAEILAKFLPVQPKARTVSTAMPWEMDSSRAKVVDGYAAKIIGEDGNEYIIEFHDRDMSLVEARIAKSEFANHPEPPTIGTHFGFVFFRLRGQPGIQVSAWPVKQYWHPSLRTKSE